jgi:hypothetical protein
LSRGRVEQAPRSFSFIGARRTDDNNRCHGWPTPSNRACGARTSIDTRFSPRVESRADVEEMRSQPVYFFMPRHAGFFSDGRPAVRGRIDVDPPHGGPSRARCDCQHTVALAENFLSRPSRRVCAWMHPCLPQYTGPQTAAHERAQNPQITHDRWRHRDGGAWRARC